MDIRDKVLKGLEYCINKCRCPESKCPYCNLPEVECQKALLTDAYILLKSGCFRYWNNVKYLVPENENEVFVCTRSKNGSRNIDKGYYTDGRWAHRGTAEVIYWMPLPELPEKNQ